MRREREPVCVCECVRVSEREREIMLANGADEPVDSNCPAADVLISRRNTGNCKRAPNIARTSDREMMKREETLYYIHMDNKREREGGHTRAKCHNEQLRMDAWTPMNG